MSPKPHFQSCVLVLTYYILCILKNISAGHELLFHNITQISLRYKIMFFFFIHWLKMLDFYLIPVSHIILTFCVVIKLCVHGLHGKVIFPLKYNNH